MNNQLMYWMGQKSDTLFNYSVRRYNAI